jgi:hypothetical protein
MTPEKNNAQTSECTKHDSLDTHLNRKGGAAVGQHTSGTCSFFFCLYHCLPSTGIYRWTHLQRREWTLLDKHELDEANIGVASWASQTNTVGIAVGHSHHEIIGIEQTRVNSLI